MAEPADHDAWRDGGRGLRPARDTGIALQGRLARESRRRTRERRQRTAIGVAAAVGALLLAIGWRYNSDLRAAEQPLGGNAVASSPVGRRTNAADPAVGQMRAVVQPEADPTPIFASNRGLKLRLPVRLEDLTELGFHQASYGYALHLKTPLPTADMKAAKKQKSTHRDLSRQATGSSAVLTGSKLVMWRSRPGKPDTAVDIGAKPGSDVLAPVSGTVVKVKRYKLYGKYDDFEVHIRPTGFPKVDCVLIHIGSLSVRPGDVVEAGVTRIAAIRKLSDKEKLQLGDYTRGGGDHTHIQLNDVTDPDYEGLKGAISPEAAKPVTRRTQSLDSAR